MSKQKTVSFPNMLDDTGKALSGMIAGLKKDALKPALVSDIISVTTFLFGLQQLMAMMYNLNVGNYEVLAKKLADAGQEIDELKKRIIHLENK